MIDKGEKIVAIGWLSINTNKKAASRFLAVNIKIHNKGLRTLEAIILESVAYQNGVKQVAGCACEDAIDFFAKLGCVN